MHAPDLKTNRLRLRRWRADEHGVLRAILRDPETMRFWPTLPTEEMVDAWFANALRMPGESGLGRLAVERLSDGLVVGDAGLWPKDMAGEAVTDLGYIFKAAHHGHGYATEAARALLVYGSDTLGLTNIVCHMAEDHAKSRAVAERIGMVLSGTFACAPDLGKTHLIFRQAGGAT